MIKKIVAIGPESTGKSTLCKQLANHYRTLWVPEFAREYLEKYGTDYSYENLLTIAQTQVALEEQCEKTMMNNKWTKGSSEFDSALTIHPSPLLFIDTDMYVMKVWCEFVFDKCHNWILNQIVTRQYDLYLVCDVDLPWIKDKLREYPNFEIRNKLYRYYKDLMVNQAVPWVGINGNYKQRLKKSIEAINSIIT
jgi:NadR type nicotinamide-nucleotide adenylyltransferase